MRCIQFSLPGRQLQAAHNMTGVAIIKFSTLLAIEPPVSQWLERPNYNSAGRENDSHLELGIFSELSSLRILRRLNNGSVRVLTLDSSCLITGSQSHDCI